MEERRRRMISVLAKYQPASQLLCPAFFSLFSAPSYRSQGHNKGKPKKWRGMTEPAYIVRVLDWLKQCWIGSACKTIQL
jgi:hypothetical protein